jgi:NTP pyrophosphatase (non-canonical NTP hydrolase)
MSSGDFADFGTLAKYQELAKATDQMDSALRQEIDPELALKRLVPLLGMAGEVGSLLVEYKKYLRDGNAHPLFPDHVAEELGDILWYLANTATNFDQNLTEIAAQNLEKTRRRWSAKGEPEESYVLFDEERPTSRDNSEPKSVKLRTLTDSFTSKSPSMEKMQEITCETTREIRTPTGFTMSFILRMQPCWAGLPCFAGSFFIANASPMML